MESTEYNKLLEAIRDFIVADGDGRRDVVDNHPELILEQTLDLMVSIIETLKIVAMIKDDHVSKILKRWKDGVKLLEEIQAEKLESTKVVAEK